MNDTAGKKAGNRNSGAVTVYGRPGCHLCAEALAVVQPVAARLGVAVREVNIEVDDALLRRYLEAIPVICVGEIEVARLVGYRRSGFAQRLEEFVRDSY